MVPGLNKEINNFIPIFSDKRVYDFLRKQAPTILELSAGIQPEAPESEAAVAENPIQTVSQVQPTETPVQTNSPTPTPGEPLPGE